MLQAPLQQSPRRWGDRSTSGIKLTGDKFEGGAQFGSDRGEGGNGGDRHQGGDQTIFDRRRAPVVRPKTLQQLRHGYPTSSCFQTLNRRAVHATDVTGRQLQPG